MFLYYIPADSPLAANRAALDYAFEGPPLRNSVSGGPDKKSGTIFADAATPGPIGYYPGRHIWKKIPGLDAWLGRNKGIGDGEQGIEKIGPEQFARSKQLRGELVALGDGNLWLIPVARAWTEIDGDVRWYTPLPQARMLDELGKWTAGNVLAKYAALWDYATAWFDARMGVAEETGKITLDFQGENEACVAALAANYRVSAFEVSELGLLSSDVVADVLDALIDYGTLLAWSKKKLTVESTDPVGASFAAGETAAIPAIDRP